MIQSGTRPITHSWQLWRDRRGRVSWLRVGTLVVLLMPLAKAVFQANDIAHGARPLNELIHRAGFWALVFLGVTLAVTPFRHILRSGNLIDVRRMLGVGTFCYIAAHLALFFADQSYSLGKVIHEITHRVYLVVGAVAWPGPCRAGRDFDRWHGAPARRKPLAAPPPDHLRHRAVRAHPLFPANESRRDGADLRGQSVSLADRLSRARLAAGHQ
jgi:hypothetical protein